MRFCLEPGCSALVEGQRVTWCPSHDRHVPFGGGKKKPAGWTRIAALVLRRDGHRCQIRGAGCSGRATQVDHVVASSEGGSDDPSNLRAVCVECHFEKSEAERQRGLARARREGRDGW